MLILAQTGSDFSEFMRQPFISGALSLICVFGLLLLGVITALVVVRRRKAATAAAASDSPAPEAFVSSDMPDFDMLTTGFERTPAPVSNPTPLLDVPPVRTVRKGTFTMHVNDGQTTEAVEMLTILRDVMSGTLIVQMGDKAYQNVNNDADFKDRFNKLMRELAQVAKTPSGAPPIPAAPPPPPSPTPTVTNDVPVIDTASSGVDVSSLRDAVMEQAEVVDETPSFSDLMKPPEPPKPRPAAPPPPPAPRTGTPLPGDLPGFTMADYEDDRPKRGKKYEPRAVPELNIAGAIEAYLQHKLHQTPEYAGRNIHIYPSPDGGVSIEVDGQYFDAVGDISDPDVRAFVAGAIQEWQDRH